MILGICDESVEKIEKIKNAVERSFEVDSVMPGKVMNPGLYIKTYEPYDLYTAIEKGNYDCDILIIAVEFQNSDYTGIDIVTHINDRYPCSRIIYVANTLQYAIRVYDTYHSYFMLRDDMDSKIIRAINIALAYRTDRIMNEDVRNVNEQ